MSDKYLNPVFVQTDQKSLISAGPQKSTRAIYPNLASISICDNLISKFRSILTQLF